MINRTSVHNVTDRRFLFLGVELKTLLSSTETGGQFSMIEGIIPPGGDGGLHVHTLEDETMYLLEGELEVTAGDRVFTLHAGEANFAPRNVPQRLRNRTNRPARALVITTPGGFDAFIEQAGVPLNEGVVPTMAKPPTAAEMNRLIKLAADFGITILEPPSGT